MEKKQFLEQIEQVLDAKIRPALAMHAGNMHIVDFDEHTGILKIKLEGTCEGCAFADETLYGFVEEELLSNFPDLNGIEPLTTAAPDNKSTT